MALTALATVAIQVHLFAAAQHATPLSHARKYIMHYYVIIKINFNKSVCIIVDVETDTTQEKSNQMECSKKKRTVLNQIVRSRKQNCYGTARLLSGS